MGHQKLPRSGEKREALRQKGQFWTPNWVADAMVAFVLQNGANRVFDPAVGEGAFWHAVKRINSLRKKHAELRGTEIDKHLIDQKLAADFTQHEMRGIENRDFLLDPLDESFDAIVANPPYIRHHRIPPEYKAKLKLFMKTLPGCHIDGRAGLHIYFLLRALQHLNPDGRLAFIVPADTFEGVFAKNLWAWISTRYSIESITTFTPEATPFPGVDTNAVIVCIINKEPQENYFWARCKEANSERLALWFSGKASNKSDGFLQIEKRRINDWIQCGLTRPNEIISEEMVELGDIVRVMRGVATGANDFFFLTEEQVYEYGISNEFLLRAIGRTRDINGIENAELTSSDLDRLSNAERPTFLFSPDGRALEAFPPKVKKYLLSGLKFNLQSRALISTRRPWYKMEQRTPPPFLFAYLGRRNVRFIKNTAGAIPLTGFLCVYPKLEYAKQIDKVWGLLRHPEILDRLDMVGKSYGGGAIKVEPRSLERLPIPARILREVKLILANKKVREPESLALFA